MQEETKPQGNRSLQNKAPLRNYTSPPGSQKPPDSETDQFNYDTPYQGGSVSDRAGIEAAREGKLVADKDDIARAKEEVTKETR